VKVGVMKFGLMQVDLSERVVAGVTLSAYCAVVLIGRITCLALLLVRPFVFPSRTAF